jgi:uncharacterized protein (TIGR03083 family)
MNAADILKYGHLTVLGAVDGLPEADWEIPGACGVWSVKNIIAHLASYEVAIAELLASFVGEAPTPTLDRLMEPGSGFNDREVETRATLSPTQTLDEYASHCARVADLVVQIPPETLRRPGTLPWYGAEYALDDLLVYMVYGHKREHCAQIALFRDKPLHASR